MRSIEDVALDIGAIEELCTAEYEGLEFRLPYPVQLELIQLRSEYIKLGNEVEHV